jgi:hypothetical protein
LLNYLNVNDEELREKSPCFRALCLPGMNDTFKLHVFIHINSESGLRTVFVCEGNSAQLKAELEKATEAILYEFKRRKIFEVIEQCEGDMFSRISKITKFYL